MALVDIIILAVLLVFMIIGVARGFIKSVLGLVGTLVSLVAAFFLAKPFLALVDSFTGIIGKTAETFSSWIGGLGEAFTMPLSRDGLGEKLAAALTEMNWPQFLSDVVVSATVKACGAMNIEGQTIASLLSPVLANIVLNALSLGVLYILIRFAVWIIGKIFSGTLLKIKLIRSLDRLLGMVLGLVQGALIVLLCFTVLGYFVGSKPDSAIKAAIDDSTIGSYVYENNPLPEWIAKYVNIDKIINGQATEQNDDDNADNADNTDNTDNPDTSTESALVISYL